MIALIIAAFGATAHADEVAVLVVDAPAAPHGNAPGTVTLLNRNLPAGSEVKLQIPIPGSDPTSGSVVMWPEVTAPCGVDKDPGAGAKQRHEIGLVTSGSGDARVLEGTIPPLQLARRYCIVVHYDQRIPTDVLASVAGVVADTPINWRVECATANREQVITKAIEDALAKQLAIYPKLSIPAARIAQAAKTIGQLFDIAKHCEKVMEAISKVAVRSSDQKTAADRLTAAKFQDLCVTPPPPPPGSSPAVPICVKRPPSIASWPAAAVEPPGGGPRVETLLAAGTSGDIGEISTIGAALALADGELGAQVQALAGARSAAERQTKLAALANVLRTKPPARELVLYLPIEKKYERFGALGDRDPLVAAKAFAALLANLKANGPTLIAQLQIMRASDPAAADAWIRLLTQLDEAERALVAANAAQRDADAAADTTATSVQNDLKTVVQSDTVKDLLRTTSSQPVATSSSKAPSTDERASWISPNIGMLVAAPIVKRGDDTGVTEGWIQPYIGASVYFARVDRVIDLDDLVGDVRWQRNSFIVGILPNKPNVNGRNVAGPWDAAVVPFVGFGHRFTQYIRADVGVIPFKYSDANPTISDTDWGVAIWLGGSLDADVWTLVAGR